MVNQQKKSKCQLRLEARSLAYQQKKKHDSSGSDSDDQPYAARVQRAAESRSQVQRQRRAHARARVQHAQRVAAETWAKRREAVTKSRAAAREKLEVASARREDALQRLQDGCKRRLEAVLEKVESVKEIQRYREERQRRALEDQLVDAARRRDEQTQKMVRRLSQRWQCVESVKDRVQRAKFIQRWFRRHVEARKAAKKLQTVKSHVETLVQSWQRIAKCNFEESMMVMQKRELARAAQYVLRVLLPSATGDASPSKAPVGASPRSSKSAPFRVLLMVGMLAAHPAEIMENNKCDRLAFASKAVVHEMERILVCLRDSEEDGSSAVHARALKKSVSQLEARFAFYFECFSFWKDRDAERLAAEMLRSYHDIYRTKIHYMAKAQKEVDHASDGLLQLLQQTEKQLVQLRGAVTQVIGKDEATQRINAIEQSCRESSHDNDEEDMEVEQEAQPSTVNGQVHETAAAGVNVPIQPSSMAQDSPQPPTQVIPLLGDEKLVHELILNPSFRIPSSADPSASDSVAGRIRNTMVKAFWDQAVAANDIDTLLLHLEELRSLFSTVVKSRPDLVESVSRALEPSAMRALLSNPAENFQDIRACCDKVLTAIRQAEAPARNDTTDAFSATFRSWFDALVSEQPNAPKPIRILVDFLAFALDKVEQVRADMINAHLGVLAAYLSRHGSDYEQRKFQDKLGKGLHLPLTEKWLEEELATQYPGLSLEMKNRLGAGNALAYSEVIRTAMMSLVMKRIEGSPEEWPETFSLDVDRIRGYRDALDRMTLISTILIILQDYIARRRLPMTRDFFSKLGKDLSLLLSSPGVSGANLVTRAMDELLKFQSANGVNIGEDPEFRGLEERLQAGFQAGNPIFSLFSTRVMSAVKSVVLIDRGSWEMHPSLLPFETELRELANEMQKLFKHNEVVHATFYNAAIKKSLSELQL